METKQEVFNELLEEYKNDLLDSATYTRLTNDKIEEYSNSYKERYEKAKD